MFYWILFYNNEEILYNINKTIYAMKNLDDIIQLLYFIIVVYYIIRCCDHWPIFFLNVILFDLIRYIKIIIKIRNYI